MTNPRLLVVEDSPTERYLLERLLAPRYTVEAYGTAEEGLAALTGPSGPAFALVLMDIVLPGLDGFAATRAIRHNPATAHIPVVLCTTKNSDTDINLGLRYGAARHIPKPIDGPRLLEILYTILRPDHGLAESAAHQIGVRSAPFLGCERTEMPSSTPDQTQTDTIETVYQNPWFSVRRRVPYHWVEQARTGAVLLLQRADQTIALVRHHRVAADTILWEFPRGSAKLGEDLAVCAAREGTEETGYTIDRGTVRLLGYIYPDAGLVATRVEAYTARTTTLRVRSQQRTRNPDAIERAAIHGLTWVPPDHLVALIRQGGITDGFTLSAWALWVALLPRKDRRW